MDENATSDDMIELALADEPVQQKRGIALSVLHWIELRSLMFEFGKIRQKHVAQSDEWWVTLADQIRGPVPFKGALEIALESGIPVAVVHDSLTEEDPTPWQPISYSSWVAQPQVVKVWTPAFWIVCSILGWLAIYVAVPSILRIPAQIAYWGGIGYFLWKKNRSQEAV